MKSATRLWWTLYLYREGSRLITLLCRRLMMLPMEESPYKMHFSYLDTKQSTHLPSSTSTERIFFFFFFFFWTSLLQFRYNCFLFWLCFEEIQILLQILLNLISCMYVSSTPQPLLVLPFPSGFSLHKTNLWPWASLDTLSPTPQFLLSQNHLSADN